MTENKRKHSQSLQDYEDELLSSGPAQTEETEEALLDDDEETARYYSAAHRDSSVSFDEHEEEGPASSCLYKTIFFVLLLILGGIATLVLVDEGTIGAVEVQEESVHHRVEEVVLGEDHDHGEEDDGVRGGLVDVGEFVERVVNSFRLSEIFSEREFFFIDRGIAMGNIWLI